MSAPLWVHELATAFWHEAGEQEPFPRHLRRAIARSLPLTVVSLPRLRVGAVNTWLLDQSVPEGIAAADRQLCACLLAYRGHGVVFLDSTDPEEEQRFSLAHELAHFLRDYRAPRARAVRALGEEVLEVFDGERPARPEERIHALVASVPIGLQVHLMERDRMGAPADEQIDAAEWGADRLAFELLAPEEGVRAGLAIWGAEDLPAVTRRVLRRQYGLPEDAARRYARLLLGEVPPQSFLRLLLPAR